MKGELSCGGRGVDVFVERLELYLSRSQIFNAVNKVVIGTACDNGRMILGGVNAVAFSLRCVFLRIERSFRDLRIFIGDSGIFGGGSVGERFDCYPLVV